MGMAVVTVASGGMAVIDVTPIASMTPIKYGMPVTEATNGRGVRVTKVAALGLPVIYETIGVGPGLTYATFNPATATAVTLSGGNLVATNTGTTAAEQGAKSATAKTNGKYYFETTFTSYAGTTTRIVTGVGTSASTYAGMSSNATAGAVIHIGGGIHANGVGNIVDIITGSFPLGTVIGVAVDLDNRKCWFRQTPSGLWNGSATASPATGTEGVTIPAGAMVPFCTFGGTGGTANNITTANFGASAFNGAVPSGYTAGWPA